MKAEHPSSDQQHCPECKNRIFHSGGHNIHCAIRRTNQAWANRYAAGDHITTGSQDFDGFYEFRITGGLTESEFFGGDVGDKG